MKKKETAQKGVCSESRNKIILHDITFLVGYIEKIMNGCPRGAKKPG